MITHISYNPLPWHTEAGPMDNCHVLTLRAVNDNQTAVLGTAAHAATCEVATDLLTAGGNQTGHIISRVLTAYYNPHYKHRDNLTHGHAGLALRAFRREPFLRLAISLLHNHITDNLGNARVRHAFAASAIASATLDYVESDLSPTGQDGPRRIVWRLLSGDTISLALTTGARSIHAWNAGFALAGREARMALFRALPHTLDLNVLKRAEVMPAIILGKVEPKDGPLYKAHHWFRGLSVTKQILLAAVFADINYEHINGKPFELPPATPAQHYATDPLSADEPQADLPDS